MHVHWAELSIRRKKHRQPCRGLTKQVPFPAKPGIGPDLPVVDHSVFETLPVNSRVPLYIGCLHQNSSYCLSSKAKPPRSLDNSSSLQVQCNSTTHTACQSALIGFTAGQASSIYLCFELFASSTSSSTVLCCAANMAARKKQEECVYNWGQMPADAAADTVPVAPRMKTYHVSAPAAAAPRRMHEDSSQVRPI